MGATSMLSRHVAIALLVVLIAVNILVDMRLARGLKAVAGTRSRPYEHYSWMGEDYAPRLLLDDARPAVHLSLEESQRYWIHTPESEQEWLYMATVGDNNVHLGGHHRYFSISLTHEIHCLNALRDALQDDKAPVGHAAGHLAHCLSYLRQSTLCAADTTLEPVDMMAQYDRVGGDHRCMDWTAFYKTMKDNWSGWLGWKKKFYKPGSPMSESGY